MDELIVSCIIAAAVAFFVSYTVAFIRSKETEESTPPELNHDQQIALRYYKAYAALCGYRGDGVSKEEQKELTEMRTVVFQKYKKYDPDNSFDVSKY